MNATGNGGNVQSSDGDAGRPLDLSTLKQFLIFIESPRAADDFNRAAHRTLSHYTDFGGLQGILSQDDLWLTNCRFSNDDGEIAHGYRVAKDVIADELRTAVPADRDYLERLEKLLDPETPDDVYVCCFCLKNNLLSQWRGYGAHGVGVSIDIDAGKFSWATGVEMPLGVMRMWKVYYKPDEQKELIRSAIQFGRQALNGQDPEAPARRAADAIKFFIPTFKDPDFNEEDEWRLIFTPGLNCTVPPEFRVARQMLVPYYRLRRLLDEAAPLMGQPVGGELAKLPIKHITVGPNPRGLLNKKSVEMLLKRWKYPDVPVVASKTSYRGA